MINEHQGGEVCRSPTSPPSRDGLRIGPGRAPPRILRGTRPGCSAAAAAAAEHSGLLAPVGPLRSAFRPPARLRCSLRRCLRPGVAPGLRLPPAAAPAARAGPRRGPLGLACRRLRSPAAQAAPAPRPPRCGSGCGPARRGPSSRGAVLRVALGLLRARCARPPRRCGLPSALSPARCGRGPPSAAPAGAARRLRRRLPFAAPPRGLWRGFAPLSQAPGPAAGGVGSPLRRRGCLAAAGRLRRWYTKRRYAQGPPRRARHTCEPLRSRISPLTELVRQGIQQRNLWPVVL